MSWISCWKSNINQTFERERKPLNVALLEAQQDDDATWKHHFGNMANGPDENEIKQFDINEEMISLSWLLSDWPQCLTTTMLVKQPIVLLVNDRKVMFLSLSGVYKCFLQLARRAFLNPMYYLKISFGWYADNQNILWKPCSEQVSVQSSSHISLNWL